MEPSEKPQIEEQATTCSSDQGNKIGSFLSETSLHGVRFIANKDASVFRRVAWLIFVLGALIYFILNFSQSLVSFLQYNSVVSESTYRAEPDEGLEFPAVTFCPNNVMRKSKMLELYPDLLEASLSYHRAQLEDTFNPVNTTSNPNFREFFDEVGVSIEDTFLYCKFEQEFNCSQYIQSFLYPNGYCFTFNSKPFARYFTNSSQQMPIKMKKADSNVAVTFVLNAFVEEYSFPIRKSIFCINYAKLHA